MDVREGAVGVDAQAARKEPADGHALGRERVREQAVGARRRIAPIVQKVLADGDAQQIVLELALAVGAHAAFAKICAEHAAPLGLARGVGEPPALEIDRERRWSGSGCIGRRAVLAHQGHAIARGGERIRRHGDVAWRGGLWRCGDGTTRLSSDAALRWRWSARSVDAAQ